MGFGRSYDGVGTDSIAPLGGLGVGELAVRWGVPRVVWRDQVRNTLDLGHRLAAEGAPDGTVIIANEQTEGRGRQGRSWVSGRGTGVWLTYLMLQDPRGEGGVLSLRVGLTVARSIPDLERHVKLKWPNDIVLRDKKVGGVLCEARWEGATLDWVAVGVGINVHGPLPAHLGDSAIAVDEVVNGISRLAILDQLVPGLRQMPRDANLTPTEHREFQDRDWLVGRELSEPVEGIARGVEPDGALLVDTDRGVERVVGGTVVTA